MEQLQYSLAVAKAGFAKEMDEEFAPLMYGMILMLAAFSATLFSKPLPLDGPKVEFDLNWPGTWAMWCELSLEKLEDIFENGQDDISLFFVKGLDMSQSALMQLAVGHCSIGEA